MHRTAVADLGSNSFRLVVFSATKRWWKRTDEIYEAVRVGAGLQQSGKLAGDRVARALAVVEVFEKFCAATEVDEVLAVATSAIRDASNGRDLVKRAALDVDVLDVEAEAFYGYLAAINSTTLTDGAVLDLGGGSMQIVGVEDRRNTKLRSWPLGAVRMTEEFLAGGEPASKKQLKALRTHVCDELAGAKWLPKTGRRLVGIGGTVRNLAAAAAARAGLPSIGVQGFVLTAGALDELVSDLAALPAGERGKVMGIKPARGDLILAGAVVVQAVMEAGGFEGIEVTEAGLREGIFFERHLAERDGMFDDVRRASVENLAAQYDVDRAHAAHVSRLALSMFDGLAEAGLHPGDAHERELLAAAAALHDIGVSVDYDDHHKHSRYLVLNGGLPGFTPRELVFVAQAVRYHRKGTPAFSADLEPLAGKGDRERLDRCATLLRLAEGLERSRDQLVRSADVHVNGSGAVCLELQSDGDASVAQWAAEREGELFKRAFGRELKIRAA